MTIRALARQQHFQYLLLQINMFGSFSFGQSYYGQTFNYGLFDTLVPAFSQGGMWEGISAYLVQTLLPTVSSLQAANVFDNENTNITGYPAVTVTANEGPGRVLDNTRNMRIYRFVIRVFIDRNKQNFGVNQSEKLLRQTADEITFKLDGDPTLGGTCINAIPFQARFGYVDRQSNNIRVMEIQLDAQCAITWR